MGEIQWNTQTSDQLSIELPVSSPTSSLEISADVLSTALLRPYACALSPSVELAEFPGTDLADKVQHVLARIVAELHLIGGWAADFSAQFSLLREGCSDPSSTQPLCNCSVTPNDLEILRQDVIQEFRAELTKIELSKIMQLTDSDTKHENKENESRLTALEKSIAQLQATLHCELSVLSRRMDTGDSSISLQVLEAQRDAHDTHRKTREGQEKLSATIKVLRLEMMEQREQTQRRLQQLTRAINAFNFPTTSPTFSPRPSSPANSCGQPASGVRMETGANALGASDCFLYAKAALPIYRLDSKAREGAKSPVGRRVLTTRESQPIDNGDMEDALQVKAAVLQLPLGYGEEDDQELTDHTLEEATGGDSLHDEGEGVLTSTLPTNHINTPQAQSKAADSSLFPSRIGYTGARANSIAVTMTTTERRHHNSRLHSVPNAVTGYSSKSSVLQTSRISLSSTPSTPNATVKPKPPTAR